MHIFLDESGTFVGTRQRGSWCVVAAYVVPEETLPAAEEAILWFREDSGNPLGGELKRSDAPEWAYFRFLERLARLNGIAFAVATDTSLNGNAEAQRASQAAIILKKESTMVHEVGKEMVRQLSRDVAALPTQNYVELICRTSLAWDVVKHATLYYAQRAPFALGAFSWRFDQKNLTRNRFEATFENLAIGLMQTMSLADPVIQLAEGDYTAFERFSWDGDRPDWLPALKKGSAHLNASKIWREDLDFVDSKRVFGVQIADLIASGVFGCLRGRFRDNERAAQLLGCLMIGGRRHLSPLQLISLGGYGRELVLDRKTAKRVQIIRNFAKDILAPR